jgi:lysine 6-dehydrogenase
LKVLVLGATGNVGGRAAIELFRSGAVGDLHVAGRDHDEISGLAARFSKNATTAVTGSTVDIGEPGLAERLSGYDVVVNCAGPGYLVEETAVHAAIEARVNYVSLCDDLVGVQAVLSHDRAAAEAGVTIVSGCGVSPGITNLLADAAADELDEVSEIYVAVAASSADSDGPASAQHLVHSLAHEAPFLSEGGIASERSGTSPKLIFFPEPVGWVETFLCGHPEVVTIPRARPTLTSMQFRIGLTERVVMDLLRGSRASGLFRTEAMRRLWLKATWPTRSMIERLPPRGAAWTAARVDVHGTANRATSIVSLAVVDHFVNLASVTIKEAALALGRGEAKAKGVRGPEEVFDSAAMLRRLSERGIRAARLESEVV